MRANLLHRLARVTLDSGRTSFFPFHQLGGARQPDIGDPILHSVRARAGASPSLSRTNSTPTDASKWSLSIWGKRGALSSTQFALAGSTTDEIYFRGSSGVIDSLYCVNAGNTVLESNQLFRDPSAHWHLLVVMDASNATNALKYRVYFNGTEITSWALDSRSSATIAAGGGNFNGSGQVNRFLSSGSGAENFDGTISRIDMVDGQVLTPSSFGRFSVDTGSWVPKNYTGTYGNNGVSLRFNSVSSASDFGLDSSGNGNNYTVSNLSATAGITYDWLTDTPTNNWALLNKVSSSGTVYNGGLSHTSGGHTTVDSSVGFTSGKWYAEVTFDTSGIIGGFGVKNFCGQGGIPTPSANSWWAYDNNSTFSLINQASAPSYSPRFVSGTTWRIAVDADNGRAYIGDHLGNWIDSSNGNTGNPSTGTNPSFSGVTASGPAGALFIFSECGGTGALHWNFGQRPFVNTPPTGFKSLCVGNLPATSILKGSKSQNTLLFAGNSATRSMTGLGFNPDYVKIKARSGGNSHGFNFSKARGPAKYTLTSAADAEATDANTLTSFDADGFSLGNDANGRGVNISGFSYAAFCWKKGAQYGFDDVVYTGNGSARTIAHSLGVAPKLIFVKNLNNATAGEAAYHSASGNTKYMAWTDNRGATVNANVWNNTDPTSAVFTIGTDSWVNNSGDTFVAHLFTDVPGYAKLGGYTGNGSADGPFIWCDFRPRFVMVKRTDTNGDWAVLDVAIDPINVASEELYLQTSTNDQIQNNLDIVSNGFKLRNTNVWVNANGGTYCYLALADAPFKYATAR